jgi:hypothetical protein
MKIKSGYAGYKKAAKEAFCTTNTMNPAIKYDPEGGFYVESDWIATSRGHINLGQVYYNLNDNGRRSAGTMAQYLEAKASIIEALAGQYAAWRFRLAHKDVFYPD